MYNIQFGQYNSYDDFGLYLTNLSISEPSVKDHYVNIPARDGKIDLSKVLSDYPIFDMRTIKYTFKIDTTVFDYEAKLREVVNALHGKMMDVIHNDGDYHYHGKLTVSGNRIDLRIAQIEISLYADPYALKNEITSVTKSLSSSSLTIILTNSGKPVIPTFTLTGQSASATVTFGDSTVTFNAGTHKFASIIFTDGENTLSAIGSGTLNISYREGVL